MNQYSKIFRRFLLLAIIQVLLLKRIDINIGDEVYAKLFIYPLFVLLFPVNINRSLSIFLAFLMGIILDMFYDSPGLHSSALTFIAMIRRPVLLWLEPVDGYKTDNLTTIQTMGFNWYLAYSSIITFICLFVYFMAEAFAFVYISDVLIKTILSFIISEILIMLYMIILNPK